VDNLSNLRSDVLVFSVFRKVSVLRAGTKRRKNVTGMKGLNKKKYKG
jgi:hypothetical protein